MQQHQQAAQSAQAFFRPKLLWEVQVLNFLVACTIVLLGATVISQVAVFVRMNRIHKALSAASLSTTTSASTASTSSSAQSAPSDPTESAPLVPYWCPTPHSTAYMGNMATYDTFILMGNDFAAGEGSSEWSSHSWVQLLRAHMQTQPGAAVADIDVIVAAGRADGNLTAQGEWLQTQSKYHTLMANHRGALVFVTVGTSALLADSDSSAPLLDVQRQLDSLFVGTDAVVPFNNRDAFPIVLVAQPSASSHALFVPPERATCPGALGALTLTDLQHVATAHSALATLYAQTARRYGAILVDTDRALGHLSLAAAPSLEQTLFNTDDCETYNNHGHIALSELLAQCLAHKAYTAPA